MSGSVLRLVILVSCAHAMVHTYELALPSVEQRLAAEFYPGDEAAGQRMTGLMSNCWRFTFGFGALVAGWLVDRFGGKRMLAVYLLGCGLLCLVVGLLTSRPILFVAMFTMGAFASIYHPAGLALISHETSVVNRTRALGLHGIFGSIGIGLAPLIAWLWIGAGLSWRQYYWLLAIPGAVLGMTFLLQARRDRLARIGLSAEIDRPSDYEDRANWPSFFTLTLLAMMQGFIYSAVLSFLPRYLSGGVGDSGYAVGETHGMFWAGGALLVGCVGQYLSGRLARPPILEQQLTWITFGNVPFLAWMAVAAGSQRVIAAALFALVHFMHQPIYNTLIAKYSPRRSRSRCYGFSFAMGLGLGSLGATFNGYTISDSFTYGVLAAVAALGGLLGVVLIIRDRENRVASSR